MSTIEQLKEMKLSLKAEMAHLITYKDMRTDTNLKAIEIEAKDLSGRLHIFIDFVCGIQGLGNK